MNYEILLIGGLLIAITGFAVWRGFEQEKRENQREQKDRT